MASKLELQEIKKEMQAILKRIEQLEEKIQTNKKESS